MTSLNCTSSVQWVGALVVLNQFTHTITSIVKPGYDEAKGLPLLFEIDDTQNCQRASVSDVLAVKSINDVMAVVS